MEYGVALTPSHNAALDWFGLHTGQTVPWGDLNKGDQRFAIIPKGIYRPKGWRHSLSIKIIPGGGYPDEDLHATESRRRLRYHQEMPRGLDAATFPTNVGLANCMEDGVPIGVIRRLSSGPNTRYEVLGLGRVLEWKDRFFTIELIESHTAQLLTATGLEPASEQLRDAAPVSLADARERIAQAIVRRRGQAKFRAALMKAYGGRCAISQCDVAAVLETAHIKPYLGDHTNVVKNGLLLRADLHTLFDLKLLLIKPKTHVVVLAETLKGTSYWSYHGLVLSAPLVAQDRPSDDCLEYAWTAPAVVPST